MCGIGGIVRYDGGAADESRLATMRRALRHRGPDGEGTFASPYAGLVHTRLALVDPANGALPATSPDGRYTLVYNGEVYNAAELRGELADHWQFQTRCDAEVVLAAYTRWRGDAAARFNGMFAFFVWDAIEQAGYAARDLLGVKPFVYGHRDGELVFASEAKAILAVTRGPRRANIGALLEYLVVPCYSGVESPLLDGLHYLPPGHALSIDRAGVRVAPWGRYTLHAGDDGVTASELGDALERAVQRTLIADAPVGVFLSGGLDSTAIAAASHAALPAFTIAFTDQDRFDYSQSRIVISDDEPFAALAATELGLPRTRVAVDRSKIADDLARLARTNDALPAWEQELAQDQLARAAARTCKAVLVGDAADETHFGYHFLLDTEATASPRGVIDRFTTPIVRRDVMADPVAHFDAKYRALTEDAGHGWDTSDSRVLATTWLIVHRWLPRLLHNGDIHAMAHGLEARVPFADRELLGLAQRVGPARGLALGVEKAALRDALRGRIPETIRTRRKSALPKDQAVAPHYQREAARLLDESGAAVGSIIDLTIVRALCEPKRALDERERALLFRLICLVHWTRIYEVTLA